MNRKSFLKTATFGVALFFLTSGFESGGGGEKPLNFVFFLIDDLGWKDLGCYGSLFYETPNLDRLAGEGMRFTNAYAACPVCSPTRASILTGKYPARIHLTDWIGGKRTGKVLPPDYLHQLPLEEFTLAEAFREAGYATGFVGKWHLGDRPYFPEDHGFELNVAGNQYGYPPAYFHPYTSKRGDYSLDLEGGEEGEYLTDRLTDEAIKFLEANHEGPFLLYFSHYAVHTPLQAKRQLVEEYESKAMSLPPPSGPQWIPEGEREARQVQDHAVYAAMVESVDDSVGRVLAKLQQLGAAEKTAIFFMSDNGGLSTSEGSPTSNVPLRAGKGWLYEGGIREPMIVKWPGVTAPGSLCHEPVISNDFYPTMLQMAELTPRPGQHLDGVSLAPLLRGETPTLNREALYWHYPHYGNQGGFPGGAIRAGKYKLVESFEEDRVELYDLDQDIGEKRDLSETMPEKTGDLLKTLRRWRSEMEARMPKPNPEYGSERNE